jgi:hypothetical protein
MKKYLSIILILISAIVLFLSVRGLPGNPTTVNLLTTKWREDGPFELSPERGRFALTYSLVEHGSVYFSADIARFILPDLGFNGRYYVSLFAPALSFIVIPGYFVGRLFDASQVGTFLVISLFALINSYLIYKISGKLGAGKYAALLGGLVFLFATPAFAYAVDLYQHHVTTFIVLLSIYLLIKSESLWSQFLIFFLFALGVSLDYPNFFMMFPLALVAGLRAVQFVLTKKKISITLRTVKLLGSVGVILPMLFFFWFNTLSYGGALHTLGTSAITSIRDMDANGKPVLRQKATDIQSLQSTPDTVSVGIIGAFNSRNLLNGLYIHFLSPDRGIIYFTPVVLLGIIGIVILYKRKNKYLPLLVTILAIDILLYSLWDDPWGGWAFGSRYMIPAYSILSIFIAVALSKFKRNILFIVPFWVLLIYSVGVNTLGALTSSASPPQTEALPLEAISGKQERFSYDRSWDFLGKNGSKSFVYQTWLKKYLGAKEYFYIIAGAIALVSTSLLVAVLLNKNEEK